MNPVNPNKKSGFRGIGFYLVIILILIGTVSVLMSKGGTPDLGYSEVLTYFEEAKVKRFVISDGKLAMTMQDGTKIVYALADTDRFFADLGETIEAQRADGTLEWYNVEPDSTLPWWVSFLPYLLFLVGIGVFWYIMMNRAEGGGPGKAAAFGKARARLASNDKKKVTFADVEGAEEEKAELSEIVDFLKAPKVYNDMGARIPKGVLLVGPPGTGKTLIAKAVAGEAGVPFLSISGSDFVELYVGVGASRVRDLFDQAKKAAPAIIFIDEIDAVGRQRGAGLGGGHDEREQTLNQMLVEMDGFSSNEGVIIIAATNRPDILDPALLRPGRFDRQVYVGLPDIKGREAILRLHAKNKKFEPEIDFSSVAKTTSGFTGADLENLLNEAALLAVRHRKLRISDEELQEAFIKVIMGPEKKSHVITENDKKLTAYHEAGHAVVNYFLPTQDPVHQISIIPRGRAGGYNLNLPTADKSYSSRSEMLENVVSLLGGRVAEKLVLNDISTGASNDIERSSDIVRKMITRYGMSDALGPITYGSAHDEVFLGREFATSRNYSEKVAAEIDEEMHRIIGEAYSRCETLLNDNMESLHRVATYLLAHEIMDGEIFRRIMEGDPIEDIERDVAEKERIATEKREAERRRLQEAEEAQKKAREAAEEEARKSGKLPPWIVAGTPEYDEFMKHVAEENAKNAAEDGAAADDTDGKDSK